MAKRSGVRGRDDPAGSTALDENRWSIWLALVLLAGLVAAAILSTNSLADPRPSRNGWMRLSLFLTVFALALLVFEPLSRQMARRLQLAVVTSLLAHAIIALGLFSQRLKLLGTPEANMADELRVGESSPFVAYPVQPIEAPKQIKSFEKPYAIDAPQAPADGLTRDPSASIELAATARRATTALSERPSLKEPLHLDRFVPHRAADTWQFSRQTSTIPDPEETPIDSPGEDPSADTPTANPLNAQPLSLDRQIADVPQDQPLPLPLPGAGRFEPQIQVPAMPNLQSYRVHAEVPVRQPQVPSSEFERISAPETDPVAVLAETPGAVEQHGETESSRRSAGGLTGPSFDAREPAERIAGKLAVPGPFGLVRRKPDDVDLPSRHAQPESELVRSLPSKTYQHKASMPAAVSGEVHDVAEAFTRRVERQRELRADGQQNPLPKTEAAIEAGLGFLARQQSPDGRWTLHNAADAKNTADRAASIHADVAATGLALLAFLGAGYDHFEDKYHDTVRRGLDFLRAHQQESGAIFLDQDPRSSRVAHLYSHSIATIALCEAVGMTGDTNVREVAQKAVDYIVWSQHPRRGGWRYEPQRSSDLSVTGWHMMALQSAQLAGLDVPQITFEKIVAFLNQCRGSGLSRALFAYNPYAPATQQQSHGRQPSTVMTAVGVLMRLYTGSDRDDPDIRRAAEHLLDNLPHMERPSATGSLKNPMRDTYYWYYATQVMFHMKGHYWQAWNEALHPLLMQTQVQDGPLAGSWDPLHPVPDRWGAHAGRTYVTTLNLLSLEVAYRHLPLYEITAD